MEKTLKRPFTFTLKNYCFLTKPGIIFGNAITASAGFSLASKRALNLSLFLWMILGLSLVIASACVFNNYIDRKLDSKMPRTQNRALVKGVISNQHALVFAFIVGLIGISTLAYFSNPLAALTALLGHLVYVFIYSFSKYQTHFCTLLGSVAGATPPLVGYVAVSNQIDFCSGLLFLLITFWQMPHFFAIAIYRIQDYAKGEVPILPLSKGILSTKLNMLFYTIAFVLTSYLLYHFKFTNALFLFSLLTLGFAWIALCLKGFKSVDDMKWAKKMFFFSLIVVMAIGLTMPFSIVS